MSTLSRSDENGHREIKVFGEPAGYIKEIGIANFESYDVDGNKLAEHNPVNLAVRAVVRHFRSTQG